MTGGMDTTPDEGGTLVAGRCELVVASDDAVEQVLLVDQATLRIGRGSENDLVLPDAGKGASRRHAELRVDRGEFVIVDLQSQNGTWVNGERVQRARIGAGDEIAIGTYRLHLRPASPLLDVSFRSPHDAAPRTFRAAGRRGGVHPAVVAAVVVAGAAAALAIWRFSARAAPTQAVASQVTTTAASPLASAPPAVETRPAAPAAAVAPPNVDTPVAAPNVAPPATSAPVPADVAPPSATDAGVRRVDAPSPKRLAARDAFRAGTRLDAVGDWIGALRKFEDARELDPGLPGLDRAVRQVTEKMRVAGNDALKKAADDERAGRIVDALKEYDRATEWLPPGDPHRELARVRAEQLKAARSSRP